MALKRIYAVVNRYMMMTPDVLDEYLRVLFLIATEYEHERRMFKGQVSIVVEKNGPLDLPSVMDAAHKAGFLVMAEEGVRAR